MFDAGLEVPLASVAYRRLDEARTLATGWSGTVLVAAIVRPRTVAEIDPAAAAAMAAGPRPKELVWYVRALETGYDPTRYPLGYAPPRLSWAVIDETTGATLARGPAADPGVFPSTVAGLPVLGVAEALEARRAGLATGVVAVAGWLRAWADPRACTQPIAGLPGGGCPRAALLVDGPWSDPTPRSGSDLGPHVAGTVPPGVLIPDRAVGLAVADLGPPPPVVVLGRFGASDAGCNRDPRDCAEPFMIEAVVPSTGRNLALERQGRDGPRCASRPGDPGLVDGTWHGSRSSPLAPWCAWRRPGGGLARSICSGGGHAPAGLGTLDAWLKMLFFLPMACDRPAGGRLHGLGPARDEAGRAPSRRRRSAARADQSSACATRPPAITSRTTPRSSRPRSGVFLPFERSASADTVQAAPRSTTTRSAGSPSRSPGARTAAPRAPVPVPSSAPRSRAPATAARPTAASTTAIAVSIPLIPLLAHPNSTCLSTSVCGAWSVAIASAVPSTSAARHAAASSGGAQRRVHAERRVERVGDERAVRPRVPRPAVRPPAPPRPSGGSRRSTRR